MIQPDTQNKEKSIVSTADKPPGHEAASDVATPASASAATEGHTIKVKGLHAYYGEQHALKGIDLEYPANEVTAMTLLLPR